jgi:hypothetical protein
VEAGTAAAARGGNRRPWWGRYLRHATPESVRQLEEHWNRSDIVRDYGERMIHLGESVGFIGLAPIDNWGDVLVIPFASTVLFDSSLYRSRSGNPTIRLSVPSSDLKGSLITAWGFPEDRPRP